MNYLIVFITTLFMVGCANVEEASVTDEETNTQEVTAVETETQEVGIADTDENS